MERKSSIFDIYNKVKQSIRKIFPNKTTYSPKEKLIQKKKSKSERRSSIENKNVVSPQKSKSKSQTGYKNFNKKWPDENLIYEPLILNVGLVMADELNNYIIHNHDTETNTHTFKLTKESGIEYNLKFNSLNSFLKQFKTPINLLHKFCSISGPKEKLFGICWNKTKILLKDILDNYIKYEKDNNNCENIKTLILNIYKLINRLAVENINDKGKKFVFLNKCREIIERILPETIINKEDIKDKTLLGGKKRKKLNKKVKKKIGGEIEPPPRSPQPPPRSHEPPSRNSRNSLTTPPQSPEDASSHAPPRKSVVNSVQPPVVVPPPQKGRYIILKSTLSTWDDYDDKGKRRANVSKIMTNITKAVTGTKTKSHLMYNPCDKDLAKEKNFEICKKETGAEFQHPTQKGKIHLGLKWKIVKIGSSIFNEKVPNSFENIGFLKQNKITSRKFNCLINKGIAKNKIKLKHNDIMYFNTGEPGYGLSDAQRIEWLNKTRLEVGLPKDVKDNNWIFVWIDKNNIDYIDKDTSQ